MSDKSTVAVLRASLNFVNALLQDGSGVDVDAHNLAFVSETLQHEGRLVTAQSSSISKWNYRQQSPRCNPCRPGSTSSLSRGSSPCARAIYKRLACEPAAGDKEDAASIDQLAAIVWQHPAQHFR